MKGKKQVTRKLLAFVLAFAMIFTSSGMSVLAEEVAQSVEESRAAEAEAKAAEKAKAEAEAKAAAEKAAAEAAAKAEAEKAAAEAAAKAEAEKAAAKAEAEKAAAEAAAKAEAEKAAAEATETQAPETTAETSVEETQAPETAAPETSAPETQEQTETAAVESEEETSAAETTEAVTESETETETESETETETESETEVSYKTDFTYTDGYVTVTAKASEAAKFPEDTVLRADYMEPGTPAYEAAVAAVKNAMGISDDSEFAVGPMYDIYFLVDGQRVEPDAGNVKVTMKFAQPAEVQMPEGTEIASASVFHVEDNGNVEKVSNDVRLTADGEVSQLGFTSDSFTPFFPGINLMSAEDEIMPVNEGPLTDEEKKLSKYLQAETSILINGQPVDLEEEYKIKIGDLAAVSFNWRIPNDITQRLTANDELVYSLPRGISADSNGEVMNGSNPVGTYECRDGKVIIKYYKEFIEQQGQSDVTGSFSCDIRFTEELAGGNVSTKKEVTFEGIGTLKLDIERDDSKDSINIFKSIVNDADAALNINNREATLTVTSTGENSNVVVTDTMGDYLTLAGEGSAAFVITDKEGKTVTPSEVSIGTDKKSFTIKFDSVPDGAVYKIAYKMNVDEAALNKNHDIYNDGEEKLKNKATVKSDEKPGNESTSEVRLDKKWISKSSSKKDDNQVEWTIVVNSGVPGNSVAGAVIKDTPGENQEYVSDSFSVTPAVEGLTYESLTAGFTFPEGSSGQYTIKYKTKPTNLKPIGEENLSNTVNIKTPGGEEYPGYGNAQVGIPDGNVLKKESTGFDKATNTISWKTTFTIPQGVKFTKDVTFSDTGKNAGELQLADEAIYVEKFVGGVSQGDKTDISEQVTGGKGQASFSYVIPASELDATNAEIKFEFTYKMKIVEDLTNISDKWYNNTAKVFSDEINKSTEGSYHYTKTSIPNPLAKKTHNSGAFDQTSQGKFRWELSIQGQNLTFSDLNELYITDTLPDNHEYVEGSAELVTDWSGWDNYGSGTKLTTSINDDGTLKINLSDKLQELDKVKLNGSIYILYSSKIKDISQVTMDQNTKYVNKAKVTIDGEDFDEVSAEQWATIKKPISKAGLYNENTAPLVKYTIEVNKGGLDLNPDSDEIVLEDVSEPAITFRPGSLRVNGEKYTDYNYDFSSNKLTINLKDETPYTITYDGVVQLAPGSQFDNNGGNKATLKVTGTTSYETEDRQQGEVFRSKASSSGTNVSISVYKYDEEAETLCLLQGAEFTVYSVPTKEENGVVKVDESKEPALIGTITTDSEGYATKGSLGKDQVYLLRETKAPTDYVVSDEYKAGKYFVFPGGDNKTYDDSQMDIVTAGISEYSFNVPNRKGVELSTSLPLSATKTYKINGVEQALSDGQFKFGLYEAEDSTTVLQEKTNNAAGEISFDAISYTEANLEGAAEKTFEYFVKEIGQTSSTPDPDINCDGTVYKVTVTLKKENDALSASVTKVEKKTDADYESVTDKAIAFTNTKTTTTSVNLGVKKTVEIATGSTNPTSWPDLTFKLYHASKDGDEFTKGDPIETKEINDFEAAGDKTVAFSEIGGLTVADNETEAKYYYIIEETTTDTTGNWTSNPVSGQAVITVTVTKNGTTGVLTTTVEGVDADNNAAFTNTYSETPQYKLSLAASKSYTVNGVAQTLTDGEFSFGVYSDEDCTVLLQQKSNAANGTISFDDFKTVTSTDDVTVYVKEIAGDDATITYDSAVFEVVITPDKDGSTVKSIRKNVNGTFVDAAAVSFENTKTTTTSVKLGVKKTVAVATGSTEPTSYPTMTFTLYKATKGDDGTYAKGDQVGEAEGITDFAAAGEKAVIFDEITGLTVGDDANGATYYYIIEESMTGDTTNWTNDLTNDQKVITVTVNKDATTGELSVSVAGTTAENDVNYAAITNTYSETPQYKLSLTASKSYTVNGVAQTLTDGEFSFGVYSDEDCRVLLQQKSNAANGTISFDDFKTVTSTDDVTVYVKEIAGDDATITYDSAVFEVVITPDKDGSTVKSIRKNVNGTFVDAAAVSFENTKTTTTSVKLGVKKTVAVATGSVEPESYPTMTFTLFEATKSGSTYTKGDQVGEAKSITVTATGDTNVDFAEITGLTVGADADSATYYYIVEETMTDTTNWTNGLTDDQKVITVTVSKDDKGELSVSVVGTTAENNVNYAAITNTYSETPVYYLSLTANKSYTINGSVQQTLTPGQFTFGVYESETSDDPIAEASNDANGNIVFNNFMNVNNTNDVTVYVKEIEGTDSTITYDSTVFKVVITPSENGSTVKSIVKKVNGAVENVNAVSFANTKTTTTNITLGVVKKITVGADSSAVAANTKTFTFELYNATNTGAISGDALETITITNNAEAAPGTTTSVGTQQFTEITGLGAGTYYYVIKETAPSQTEEGWSYDTTDHLITVTVRADQSGTLTATATGVDANNNVAITNTYGKVTTTEVSGTKTWVGDTAAIRPDSVTLTLTADPAVDLTGKTTPEWTKNDNVWSYVFKDLPATKDGTPVTYTVTETSVPGYITSYGTTDAKAITNTLTSVSITKKDVVGDAELAGAQMKITDESGNVVQAYIGDGTTKENVVWTSTETATTIKGLVPGTYKLVEETAPTGFDKLKSEVTFTLDEDGNVTVTATEQTITVNGVTKTYNEATVGDNNDIVVNDAPTTGSVSISKVDIANSEEVAGATLQVVDKDGNVVKEWTSGEDGAEEITGLICGDEYTLKETVAPEGFDAITTDITFTVDEDGNVTVTDTHRTEDGVAEGEVVEGVLLVKDTKKPVSVKVSKVDIANSEEVAGATLQVFDKENNLVKEWTSGEEGAEEITGLVWGEEYTLKETVAPEGFDTITTDIKFKVDKDGNVTVTSTGQNKDGLDEGTVDENVLLVNDTKIPVSVKVSKVDIANSEEVAGAKLQVVDKNGNVVKEWTSGEDGAEEITGLVWDEEYTLKETVAPEGFDTITTDIKFKVDKDGNVTVTSKGQNKDGQDEGTVDENVLLVNDTKIPVSVKVSKVDIANGEEVAGAELQIVDKDGNVVYEWTSEEGGAEEITDLVWGEEYTLKETVAPFGYNTITTDIKFTVDKDGNVTVLSEGNDGTVKDGVLLVNDAAKPTDGSLVVRKVLMLQGEPVALETSFEIGLFTDAEGTNLYRSATFDMSNGPAEVTFDKLPEGTYYVYELDYEGNAIIGNSGAAGELGAFGFEASITVSRNGRVELGEGVNDTTPVVVTNDYPDLPEGYTKVKLDISGKKTWVDNNNAAKKRPGSLKLTLNDGTRNIKLQSADSTADYYIEWNKNAGNNEWTYKIMNVPKVDESGELIEYTVIEESVEYYESDSDEVTGERNENGDIINADFKNTYEAPDLPKGNTYTGKKPNKAAKTGDTTDYMLYLMMLMAAGILGGTAVYTKKRKKAGK